MARGPRARSEDDVRAERANGGRIVAESPEWMPARRDVPSPMMTTLPSATVDVDFDRVVEEVVDENDGVVVLRSAPPNMRSKCRRAPRIVRDLSWRARRARSWDGRAPGSRAYGGGVHSARLRPRGGGRRWMPSFPRSFVEATAIRRDRWHRRSCRELHAVRGERLRAFSGVCPPSCTRTPSGFPVWQIASTLERERLEVQAVGDVVVGRSPSPGSSDRDRLEPELRAAAMPCTAVVELDTLTDTVRAGAGR